MVALLTVGGGGREADDDEAAACDGGGGDETIRTTTMGFALEYRGRAGYGRRTRVAKSSSPSGQSKLEGGTASSTMLASRRARGPRP